MKVTLSIEYGVEFGGNAKGRQVGMPEEKKAIEALDVGGTITFSGAPAGDSARLRSTLASYAAEAFGAGNYNTHVVTSGSNGTHKIQILRKA